MRIVRAGAMGQFVVDGVDLVVNRGKDRVFAPEAGQRKHTGQRQAADQKRGVRPGHEAAEAAEVAHVDDAPHRVHHAPGAEEEQGLEEGVREQVKHAAGDAEHRAGSEGQEHVAELADRGVGQHALEIELREGDQPGEQRGEPADDGDDELSGGRRGEQRRAAGHHVHAGGDHRGGVNERADGRRAFHRIGQPDVQRELGAFAAGAQEQEQANGSGERACRVVAGENAVLTQDATDKPSLGRRVSDLRRDALGVGRAVGQRIVIVERAVSAPDQENRQREGEVADAVDEERLLAGRGRFGLFVPEADEQVAAHADRFPKDEEQQEVAHRDEHRHREDEEADVGEEPPVAAIPFHVAGGEYGHERGDEGDHAEHHGGQGVGPQGNVDPEVAPTGIAGGTGRQICPFGGQVISIGHVGPGPQRDDLLESGLRLIRGDGWPVRG